MRLVLSLDRPVFIRILKERGGVNISWYVTRLEKIMRHMHSRRRRTLRQLKFLGLLPFVCRNLIDLARHAVTAPDGRQYVVATFDDTRAGNGYVTAVYPQQSGYLTLVRLVVCEYSSETRQAAAQRHLELATAIQQGRLDDYRNRVVYHA